ncbi:hypothetical protein WGT02_31970 (plasmid) [Rhizobium sp. T1470]|uniref:hypothetical protein n=1 Tax=unclassified Rhizobium TaxID=2613769 RepID=UPI001AAF4FEF|nr:hypothetical protein [Rhizobium sp. T1473]MCA0806521.1 hypothetical protein [Rhizobium sp. T1473]
MTTDMSSCGVIELTRAEASKTCGGIVPLFAVAAAAAGGACFGIVVVYGISAALKFIGKHH